MSRTARSSRPVPPQGGMSRNTRLSLVVAGVFVLVVSALFGVTRLAGDSGSPAADASAAAATAVRPDSHRLSTAPGSTVNFVEFLDFECEACRAAFPAIEQLRQQYGDRVNFVMRYFPIPSHVNAERAARAVEAAAQQGRLEQMYTLMYETQTEWGEQQAPMDERFRGYAARLGLDMARYDAVYNDPATVERIQTDRADGQALGVQGTPTFFLNGQKLEPESLDDLTRALDQALAQQ